MKEKDETKRKKRGGEHAQKFKMMIVKKLITFEGKIRNYD